jgi:hypothetical protein
MLQKPSPEEYFDAYLYAASWGTRELPFRLMDRLDKAGLP